MLADSNTLRRVKTAGALRPFPTLRGGRGEATDKKPPPIAIPAKKPKGDADNIVRGKRKGGHRPLPAPVAPLSLGQAPRFFARTPFALPSDALPSNGLPTTAPVSTLALFSTSKIGSSSTGPSSDVVGPPPPSDVVGPPSPSEALGPSSPSEIALPSSPSSPVSELCIGCGVNPVHPPNFSRPAPSPGDVCAHCHEFIISVLTSDITPVDDDDMARLSTPKGKANASKFYGPPSPPPSYPLPPLPDKSQAPGQMTQGFAAQPHLRRQNDNLQQQLKQGHDKCPPKTPPNTPVKPDGTERPTSSRGSDGSLKSALKKAADPSRALALRGRVVRFDIHEPSVAPDPLSSYASSALDVKWPVAGDGSNTPDGSPTEAALSFAEAYNHFPGSLITSEELYSSGMTLPNGREPVLRDAPTPWSVAPLAPPFRKTITPSSSMVNVMLKREHARQVEYKRMVRRRNGHSCLHSAVDRSSYVDKVYEKDTCRRAARMAREKAVAMTWI